MKPILFAAAAAVAASASVFAQEPADPAMERALAAAPARLKAEATVIKWKPDFTYEVLKKGNQPSRVLRPVKGTR